MKKEKSNREQMGQTENTKDIDINTFISIITLKVSGTNIIIKRQKLQKFFIYSKYQSFSDIGMGIFSPSLWLDFSFYFDEVI